MFYVTESVYVLKHFHLAWLSWKYCTVETTMLLQILST